MSNKPKVLIILTPGFAASEEDSSCLPMQQAFVKALSTIRPDVSVMVLSFHYPFVRRTYNWFNVSVNSFNGRNQGGIQGILLKKKVGRELARIHREKEIVGLLSFWMGECASVGKRFAAGKGFRHYCWIQGQDARSGNKYGSSHSLPGKEIIALSDSLQEEFEMNYGIRPEKVIPPGIETRANRNECRNIDLLAVGSLIPLKQFEIFLEVVASIKKELPEIKAILIGDGPEYSRLKGLASELGIADTLTFTGSIAHNEVIDLMSRARVLLHPSSYEGYSGVCQEALSCGSHVVSFCRAMTTEVRQWHIVKTRDEMMQLTLSILKDRSMRFEPVEFEPMTSTVQQIMDLYMGSEERLQYSSFGNSDSKKEHIIGFKELEKGQTLVGYK